MSDKSIVCDRCGKAANWVNKEGVCPTCIVSRYHLREHPAVKATMTQLSDIFSDGHEGRD